MAFAPTPRSPGDLIQAQDWNDAVTEVGRLENAKIDRSGAETLSGPLTVNGNAAGGPSSSPPSMLTVELDGHINAVIDRTDSEDHMTFTVGSAGSGIHFGDNNRFFISADPYAERTTKGFGNEVFTILPSGNVGIGTVNPGEPLEMAGGAVCAAGRVWRNSCSRADKQDIDPLSREEALAVMAGLDPVTFRYTSGSPRKHVGFIAEDVPELVASADRKTLSSMDIVGVLAKVVQAQQAEIEELRAGLAMLQRTAAKSA